jgi:glycosyltransferase involved in cell wall biosynthesis
MKLLIYLHSLEAGGAERVAVTLADYWAQRGWQVTIATVASASRDFYGHDPRVARVGFDLAGNSRNPLQAALRNVARVRALRKLIRQTRPDVALALMTNANVVLALACRGMPGVRAVGSEHIFPGQVHTPAIWEALRRMHYRGLHAVVALTSECAQWILSHTSAKKAPVIPNVAGWPLPVQEPVVPTQTLCRPGRKVLLGVGRLTEQKDFGLLINVFGRIAARYPEWDLVILGRGPQHEELLRQVQSAGLADRAFLPGVVGNLGQWYEAADMYVMSSRFEGFPNTLAEALAHGLPAISFDCDTGPRDIIRHGVDGMLVPAGDGDALAEALGTVMADDDLRARMAARATEARERFSIERVAGMWERLFAEEPSGPSHGKGESLSAAQAHKFSA